MSTSEFAIVIDFGPEFRDAVGSGSTDPYVGIRIRAEDAYQYGSSDRFPKNWVTYHLTSFLQAMVSVFDGERAVVTNHDGPSYFVFEPEGDRAVQFAHALTRDAIDDPNRRGSAARSVTLDRRVLLVELLDTATDLRDRIEAENPDPSARDDLSALEEAISNARRLGHS